MDGPDAVVIGLILATDAALRRTRRPVIELRPAATGLSQSIAKTNVRGPGLSCLRMLG